MFIILDEEESVYIRNADRQRILKQRDETYRKFLIEESKRVEAKWDSFSETENDDGTAEKKTEETTKVSKGKNERKRKAAQDVPEEKTTEEEPSTVPAVPTPKVPKFKPAKVDPGGGAEPPKKKLKKKRGEQKPNKTNAEDSQLDSTPESTIVDPSIYTGSCNLMCLGCRETGHRLKHCPKFKTAMCIKCGSADHKYKDCPTSGNDFKFATCFVCKEVVSLTFNSVNTLSFLIHVHFPGPLIEAVPQEHQWCLPEWRIL